MNIATGSYNTVFNAENAVRDLLKHGFAARDIYLVTKDRSKGEVLANDLKQPEMATETGRAHEFGGITVYDRLPDAYINTLRQSNLPEDAVTWYQRELDRGNILVVTVVGNRMDAAVKALVESGGMLYGRERREPGAAEERPPAPRPYTAPPADENVPPDEEDRGYRAA